MELRGLKLWFENGQMRELDDDVLFIVRRVKEISPRLSVFWNEWNDKFTITETDLEGTERLVFHADVLDERVLHRLTGIDHWRGRDEPEHVLPDDEDFVTLMDREQFEMDKARDAKAMDKILEAGEAYASYMELDGRGTRASVRIPRDVDG